MNTLNKKWIKDLSELTRFERAIINAHPEGLVAATAEGPREIGKSMLLFKTGVHIFQYLEGIHLDDAYIRSLDHFLWTIPQIKNAIDKVLKNTDFENIRQYDAENKYRYMAIDDAGTHLGKYKFYVDIDNVDEMKARLDTIREVTNCLLMSTPALTGLLSFLRDYPDNKTIKITYDENGDPTYGRIFTVRHPRRRWEKKGRLAFPPIKGSIWVDNWAYDEYKIRKRKSLLSMLKSKKGGKLEIIRMFRTVKKMNPKLTNEEIIEKLNLSQDVLELLKRYAPKEEELFLNEDA